VDILDEQIQQSNLYYIINAMKTHKTTRQLLLELGQICIDLEEKDKRVSVHTRRSNGFAAIGRKIDVGREVVSRWYLRGSVPRWRHKELEAISPKIREGAFMRASKVVDLTE
jgi:hypothetical protein